MYFKAYSQYLYRLGEAFVDLWQSPTPNQNPNILNREYFRTIMYHDHVVWSFCYTLKLCVVSKYLLFLNLNLGKLSASRLKLNNICFTKSASKRENYILLQRVAAFRILFAKNKVFLLKKYANLAMLDFLESD